MQSRKVLDITVLADLLEAERAAGKTIVQCHGIFDLVHIGHVRHFQEARALGDILVVTVTPDKDVAKGLGKPIFSEHLRAEALTSIESIDYVAINPWQQATEAIRILRPRYYVKGGEYRDSLRDQEGVVALEQEAVQSVGGELVFTEDITFTSSSLLNRYMRRFPKDVLDYLHSLRERYDVDEILRCLQGIRPVKVLTVGETILDEYQYVEAIGKSSKEPMLAVRRLSTEKFAGGILAVANNVANFCDTVGVVSLLGAEDSEEEFVRRHVNPCIEQHYLMRINSPTIVKRRFVDSQVFQKLLEVYEINTGTLDEEGNEHLCATLSELAPQFDVVLVVDFGHGMLTTEAVKILCEKSRFLAVNAQLNAGNRGFHTISRYPKADYVCIAQNEIRLEYRDMLGDVRPMMQDLADRMDCRKMTITLGKGGTICYDGEQKRTISGGFIEAPAVATQIIDRMGAGDAVISITAPLVATNAPMEMIAFIANAVGAHAVATVGHRTSIERAPLLEHIESLLK